MSAETSVIDEDKEFTDAFSEAAKRHSGEVESDDVEEEEKEPVKEASTEDDDQGDEGAESSEELPDSLETRLKALEEENKKLNHRIKSDDGRVSAYQRQINELQQRINEGHEASSSNAQSPSTDDVKEAMKSDDSWAEFTEEYPEIAAAIEGRLSRSLGEIEDKIGKRIAPVEQIAAKTSMDEAYRYLDDHHEGWRERVQSSAFHEWIDTQPDVVRKWVDSDDPNEASSLIQYFDNYLSASGQMSQTSKATTQSPDREVEDKKQAHERKRAKQLQDGDGLHSSGAGIGISDDAADTEFSSAFKVAAQRLERQRNRA